MDHPYFTRDGDGAPVSINPDAISTKQQVPPAKGRPRVATQITMTSGERILVTETPADIDAIVAAWRAYKAAGAPPPEAAEQPGEST